MPKGGRFRGAGEIYKGARELEALEQLAARGSQRGHVDLGGGARVDPHMGETALSPGGVAVPADVARDRAAQLAREAEETARRAAADQAAERARDAATARRVDEVVASPAPLINHPTGRPRADGTQPSLTIIEPTAPAPAPAIARDASAMTRTRPAAPAPAAPAPATPTRVEVTVNNNGTPAAAPRHAAPDAPEAPHAPAAAARKIEPVDLTAGKMNARTELPGYIRNGLTELYRQTGKGGDHIALDAMQTQFADALRANGRLIDQRVFRKELGHPKAVEDRLRAGKEVTEGEYQALTDFQRRKLDAGPGVKDESLIRDMNANNLAGMSLPQRAIARVASWIGNSTPGLRSSLTPRYLGTASAVALTTAMGTGLYMDDDPARMNLAGRVVNFFGVPFNGVDDDFYAKYKYTNRIQNHPDRVAALETAIENRSADPVFQALHQPMIQGGVDKTLTEAADDLAAGRKAMTQLARDRMQAATSGLSLDAIAATGSADAGEVKRHLATQAAAADATSAARAIDQATRGGRLTANALCKAFEDPALKTTVKSGPTGGAVAQELNQVHSALNAPCPTLQ